MAPGARVGGPGVALVESGLILDKVLAFLLVVELDCAAGGGGVAPGAGGVLPDVLDTAAWTGRTASPADAGDVDCA